MLVHLAGFLGGSVAWILACGVLAAAWFFVMGADVTDPEATLELLGPGGMGVLTVIQIGGITGLATLLALALPGADTLRERMGLERPSPIWLATGALGALTIWTFPTWVATQLIEALPGFSSNLELITELLLSGPPTGRAVLAFSIVVTAPLCEELIFRGYAWSLLERALPPAAVWIGTSLLFAAYHLDPIHSLSLLPTALFLGWLRWVSGSVWPAVVAHFVNNALATSVAMLLPPDALDALSLVPSVLGLGASVTVAAGGWALHRRSSS